MKLEEKLVSWSDGKRTTKFIPRGGEILKTIGSSLIKVRFYLDQESHEWKTEDPKSVAVISIGDFEPMSETYKIVYSVGDTKSEIRITPEGFSWNNPEEDGWMERFIPYSYHYQIMEEEIFYGNLRTRYDKGIGVLGPTPLSQFSTGKEKKKRLECVNYISAVIDTDVEDGLHVGILAFRISEIARIEKRGKKWELGIKDQDGDYILIPKFIENPETHQWYCPGLTVNGRKLGDLKILDIESF